MQLAAALKTIRQKSFMTQESFANKLGVTASTINRWEHGKTKPNLTAMKNIKQFCAECSMDFEQIETAWFATGPK